MLLSPFVPMLFQGQEWAASSPFQYFVDYADEPKLAQAIADGRRSEFGAFGWKPEDVPDPRDEATFRCSLLNWEERQLEPHAVMLSWYQQLIRLRRTTNAFSDGQMDLVDTAFNEQERWLRVDRGPMTIVCNFATEPKKVPLGSIQPTRMCLASQSAATILDKEILVPAESVAILSRN